MKINWQNLYILWSVLSLRLLSRAADTHESSLTRRINYFKVSNPKSKLTKQSSAGDSKSSRSLPSGTSPLSQLSSLGVYSLPPPEISRSVRPGNPKEKIQPDFAYVPHVSVTCSKSDFVVRVKPAFYGLGADAEELKLGRNCKSNGVLRPYGDLLFTYPLTACDAVRELPAGYLVYKFVLHYEPSRKRFPSRAHRIDVDIECRYQRKHHVYQLAVKPTWQTAVLRKRLKGRPNDFHIDLMDDSWREPATFKVYKLGKMVNFQVSASHLPTGGELYISSCYASPSSGAKPSLKYAIIDNLGCMMDSRTEPGASQFVSRTDRTLRFSIKAFQFTADPDTEILIHCKLSISSEGPDPAHKSCTYRGNRWKALTGDDSICECCDSQCLTSKPRRAVVEGSASSGSLLVYDVRMNTEDETRINQHISEMHSREDLWESMDVKMYDGGKEEQGYVEEALEEEDDDEESHDTLGGLTEPDLDQLAFRDGVVTEGWDDTGVSSNEFGEDGPVNEVEDFLENKEEEETSEGREAEQVIHLNQKKSEVVNHWTQLEPMKADIQRELWTHDAEEQEENSKYTVRGEEDKRRTVSEVEWMNDYDDLADDGEMTWYFTWK